MGYLDVQGPVALAHRGAHRAGAVENSAAAFSAALDLGYRYLETDVHATADGVLVALHDAVLDRVADARGAVADLPWSVVGAARLGGREPVPRLEELLSSFPAARWNIDVKAPGAIAPLVGALAGRGVAERVCVASFSDRRRRAVVTGLAERGVGVVSSAGRGGVARFLAGARAGLRGRALRAVVGADCLQVPERSGAVAVVSPRTLAAARSAGLPVHVWTVNDPAAMRRLLDAGVDGLVSDATEELRAVLRERGAWPTRPRDDPSGPATAPNRL